MDINSQDGLTFTWGELVPEGGWDVLADHRLVLWCNGKEQVTSTLPLDGRIYVAAPLDLSLQQAIHFPAATEDFGTVDTLVADLQQVIRSYAPLEDDSLLLLAGFVLSSWVPECVPTVPLLNLCAPLGADAALVEVLRCLCRRTLLVGDVSVPELCNLPVGLSPTIIMTNPSKRTLQNVLAAANSPQQSVLRRGRLISFCHGAVVCTRKPLPAPALAVSLVPTASAYHRFTRAEQQALSDNIAPRLLRYRLTNHPKISSSCFDSPSFTAETRLLAHTLGSTLEGSPQLQNRLMAALQRLDEQHKVEHSQSLPAFVAEALLALCRLDTPTAYVEEITEMTNAILVGRHESLQLTSKKVGGILRNELGLYAERQGHGYRLVLDRHARQQIQQLAETYSVLSLASPAGGAHTKEVAASLVDVHGVHDVQDFQENTNVHDVHNVHSVEAS